MTNPPATPHEYTGEGSVVRVSLLGGSQLGRFTAGLLIVLGYLFLLFAWAIVVRQLVGGQPLASNVVLADALDIALDTVVPALAMSLLLPRVSYRRRDWLIIAFVPLYNVMLLGRLGIRLALLPYRDWPPRPDEEPRVRRIPGTDLYVLADEATRSDGSARHGDLPE